MLGCTNPAAINYNPSATEADGSCVFLNKIDGVCYHFKDVNVESLIDKSFTLSFALEGENWVFYHDYIPDFYFSTREQIYAIQNSKVWKMGVGSPGQYFNTAAKSFFIDVIFKDKEEMILNSLNWVTEVINRVTGENEEFSTLSHLTIWNNWQCTGRLPLSQIFENMTPDNTRKTQSVWHFNEFRDIVTARGQNFLGDIFSDFAVDVTKLDEDMPWYEQRLIEDTHFVVRLEFDNSANKVVFLHDVNADVNPSFR